MEFPQLSKLQSEAKGQKRINQAIDSLGIDVVNKILGFSLYVLGFSYDFISKNIDFSEPGIKTLIQDILENGVERFVDKRKKVSYSILKKGLKETVITPTVEYTENDEEYIQFMLMGPISLKLKKDDKIGKKLLTLLFLDSNLLRQVDAADILNCNRLAVNQNYKRYKSSGSEGLIDSRWGQKKDYKFDIKVKGEIIKESVLSFFNNKVPTKTSVSSHLRKKFSKEYSERAVALHLKNIGLTESKRELFSKIVYHVNEKINSLEYLRSKDTPLKPEYERHLELIKKFKEGLGSCSELDKHKRHNIYQTEKRIEVFQSELQGLLLESIMREMKGNFKCPSCQSGNVVIHSSNDECKKSKILKTSLGGNLVLPENLLPAGRCNKCETEFDIKNDILKISKAFKYTPLTQKKICSANRAGSYKNAVKNLEELINLDINRNQVRKISNHVGEYINKEFRELYKDILEKLPREIIFQKHPLVEELKIDEKYLDTSKYLIVFAVDGGRMQLFNWIPPGTENNNKAKKKLYWHEDKVFRISIYDKTNFEEITSDKNGKRGKGGYKSAKIISGLTTYGATNVIWKETAPLIISHLYIRGIRPENVQVCLSDGSEHIMKEIFTPIFPNATHILDYYHKVEALHGCLKTLGIEEKTEEALKQHLWEGEVNQLINRLKKIQLQIGLPLTGKKRNPDDPKVSIDNLINHLSKNRARLKYKQFREERYPIGSGSIESAVKLFGKRIKGTEKQWNEKGGESILNLYSFLLSEDDRWNKLWEFHTPWLEYEVPF